nr:hypothetical protein [Microbacterium sp. NIBRBAC000506063]
MSGRASGRATSDAGEGGESPTRLVAITWNTYSTLLVSPSRVQVVAAHWREYSVPWIEVTV